MMPIGGSDGDLPNDEEDESWRTGDAHRPLIDGRA